MPCQVLPRGELATVNAYEPALAGLCRCARAVNVTATVPGPSTMQVTPFGSGMVITTVEPVVFTEAAGLPPTSCRLLADLQRTSAARYSRCRVASS